jgi:hypothetical protein
MSDEACAFSLVTEPWIPVVWRDGATERPGAAEALRTAHQVRGIVAGDPGAGRLSACTPANGRLR